MQQRSFVHRWAFSVDEWAVGLPGVPADSVTIEAAPGVNEASGDVFDSTTAPHPIGIGSPGVNAGRFDGNGGLTTFASQGLNLMEPNPPSASPPIVNKGDNADALDVEQFQSIIPEPATLVLLALGGLAAMRRRHRA